QDLRAALLGKRSDDVKGICFPMGPIGVIHSCFSTRNGTPRQPLLVPLARACLVFDASRVPPACLEGLEGYSHCWIIYVFHLNTDLEKLWKEPSRSKLKAKVRVPRLNGETTGVFATRSPHRPCPIGLTVSKVEAVHGNMVLLSGTDLVDGTPVLDIKPYLPYCDSIKEATVPEWVMADNVLAVNSVSFSDAFSSTLADCWDSLEPRKLYSSPEEIQTLIKQVLSWDIRSPSQRKQPHNSVQTKDHMTNRRSDQEILQAEEQPDANANEEMVVYHLALEGLDISYRIDDNADVTVDSVVLLPSGIGKNNKTRPCSYTMWKDMLG
ncbi:tRNA (adenine(37)-N6)-methyltransferase-like protein, partial [Drosera capensis]